jgi:hypothetical protein
LRRRLLGPVHTHYSCKRHGKPDDYCLPCL